MMAYCCLWCSNYCLLIACLCRCVDVLGSQGLQWVNSAIYLQPYVTLLKRIGYSRLLLFLLLTQPTSGRHWQYYGWLLRLAALSTAGFSIGLCTVNYPYHALAVLCILLGIRWYQRIQQLREREKKGIKVVTLKDLREYITRDLPYPVEEHDVVTRDNVRLRYQTIGKGKELIFLANGIGGTIYHFDPLLNQLARRGLYDEKFTVVSWDFRSMFNSDTPVHSAAMSVRDHAEDVMEICKDLNRETVHTIVGWSTGVQIALELVSMYPERIGRAVLLNGSHGRTLQSACQPILRVPWMGDLIHSWLNFVRRYMTPYYKSLARSMLRHKKALVRCLRPYGLIYNQVDAERFFAFYLIDIFNNFENHTHAYLLAFQFLDAHSSEHLLADIQTPTLIVTAMLDFLTPAYLSYEMNRSMPNARMICHMLCTHFALLEKPDKIGAELMEFIADESVEYSPHYTAFLRDEHDHHEDGLVHPERKNEDDSDEASHGDKNDDISTHNHPPFANREGIRRQTKGKSRSSSISHNNHNHNTFDVLALHQQQEKMRLSPLLEQQHLTENVMDEATEIPTELTQLPSKRIDKTTAQRYQHQIESTVDAATDVQQIEHTDTTTDTELPSDIVDLHINVNSCVHPMNNESQTYNRNQYYYDNDVVSIAIPVIISPPYSVSPSPEHNAVSNYNTFYPSSSSSSSSTYTTSNYSYLSPYTNTLSTYSSPPSSTYTTPRSTSPIHHHYAGLDDSPAELKHLHIVDNTALSLDHDKDNTNEDNNVYDHIYNDTIQLNNIPYEQETKHEDDEEKRDSLFDDPSTNNITPKLGAQMSRVIDAHKNDNGLNPGMVRVIQT